MFVRLDMLVLCVRRSLLFPVYIDRTMKFSCIVLQSVAVEQKEIFVILILDYPTKRSYLM